MKKKIASQVIVELIGGPCGGKVTMIGRPLKWQTVRVPQVLGGVRVAWISYVVQPKKKGEEWQAVHADICPSCDVAYVDHRGLNGTCAALQEAMNVLDQIATLPPRQSRRVRALASSCHAFLTTIIAPVGKDSGGE